MNNTKNIILIASITAVLGFGIVALQTNTVSVDALMDNTSEFLDLGEKSEITIFGPPDGKGKKTSLEDKYEEDSDATTIKCSASRILKCTIKNSADGLERVALGVYLEDGFPQHCDSTVKDGASRISVDTRGSNPLCDFDPEKVYRIDVTLANSAGQGCYTVLVKVNDSLEKILVIDQCEAA